MPYQKQFDLAKAIIEQWEKYDQHRVTEADKVLFQNGKEPDEVVLARAFCDLIIHHYGDELPL